MTANGPNVCPMIDHCFDSPESYVQQKIAANTQIACRGPGPKHRAMLGSCRAHAALHIHAAGSDYAALRTDAARSICMDIEAILRRVRLPGGCRAGKGSAAAATRTAAH